MALTHPNSIFRWEDAASLEHACWQCPTKANSPRALQTCYGVHSMPCTSYHPTMHAVGAAHRCSGCINTREMHDARHREIAELLAEFKLLESAQSESPSRPPLVERSVNVNSTTPVRQERIISAEAQAMSKEKALETSIDDTKNHEEFDGDGDGDGDDDDLASPSSYALSSAEMGPAHRRKLTKAEIRSQKKAKKSTRSQTKALKNQNKHTATVTLADIEHIAEVLHGEERNIIRDGAAHPLVTDRTIEDVISRNLNFVKNIQAHKACLFKSVAIGRKETKDKKRLRKRETLGETSEEAFEIEEVVSAIMLNLGINPAAVSASASCSSNVAYATPSKFGTNTYSISTGRKRANSNVSPLHCFTAKMDSGISRSMLSLAGKLRLAIKSDLEKHENEVHARYVRAGGFWRYVGKTVFERMTDVARELDVGTGERWEKKNAREQRSVCEDEKSIENKSAGEEDVQTHF